MKPTLLLNYEGATANLMLQNIPPVEAILPDHDATAGCNCDRWGHPCPGCDERKVQPKTEFPIPSDSQTN